MNKLIFYGFFAIAIVGIFLMDRSHKKRNGSTDTSADFDHANGFSWMGNGTTINPASGMPMIDGVGGFDVGGNSYGCGPDHSEH